MCSIRRVVRKIYLLLPLRLRQVFFAVGEDVMGLLVLAYLCTNALGRALVVVGVVAIAWLLLDDTAGKIILSLFY